MGKSAGKTNIYRMIEFFKTYGQMITTLFVFILPFFYGVAEARKKRAAEKVQVQLMNADKDKRAAEQKLNDELKRREAEKEKYAEIIHQEAIIEKDRHNRWAEKITGDISDVKFNVMSLGKDMEILKEKMANRTIL